VGHANGRDSPDELVLERAGGSTGDAPAQPNGVDMAPSEAFRTSDTPQAPGPGEGRDDVAGAFHSILEPSGHAGSWAEVADEPTCFGDLNLDQIVAKATSGKEGYALQPIFHAPCGDTDTIAYRQHVFADLRAPDVLDCVKSFAERMHMIRVKVADANKIQYNYNKKLWLLEAISNYCEAVVALHGRLKELSPRSDGLNALARYLATYLHSDAFRTLNDDTKSLKKDLAGIRYEMLIRGDSVVVRKYQGGSDYSADVLATFEKFKQGSAKDYRSKFSDDPGMNHVEAAILERVGKLFPEVFRTLDLYVERHGDFVDETIGRFDREVQFYVGYLAAIAPLESRGLTFCDPAVSADDKAVASKDGFDLALALKLVGEGKTVVTNDFQLDGPERIIVVSGPNQGGKTTFARAFGQLHYLASLGCPVPGSQARLFLFDHLFTHFEREEDIENLRGKLEDDLVRMHADLERVTPESILVMNEIFDSTTLQDQIFLSRKVLEQIMELDALAVCVTFIDELASLSEKTVSMMSTVVPDDPATRTFKVVRKPADGLAYARSLAEKRGVTFVQLKERIGS